MKWEFIVSVAFPNGCFVKAYDAEDDSDEPHLYIVAWFKTYESAMAHCIHCTNTNFDPFSEDEE